MFGVKNRVFDPSLVADLGPCLATLQELGTEGHERLAIEWGTFATTSKPKTCWQRFLAFLFGVPENVNYRNVAAFTAAFFRKNVGRFNQLNTENDLQQWRNVLVQLQGRFARVPETNGVLKCLIRRIDSKQRQLFEAEATRLEEEAMGLKQEADTLKCRAAQLKTEAEGKAGEIIMSATRDADDLKNRISGLKPAAEKEAKKIIDVAKREAAELKKKIDKMRPAAEEEAKIITDAAREKAQKTIESAWRQSKERALEADKEIRGETKRNVSLALSMFEAAEKKNRIADEKLHEAEEITRIKLAKNKERRERALQEAKEAQEKLDLYIEEETKKITGIAEEKLKQLQEQIALATQKLEDNKKEAKKIHDEAVINFPYHQVGFEQTLKNIKQLDTVILCKGENEEQIEEVYMHSLFLPEIGYLKADIRSRFIEGHKPHRCKDEIDRNVIDLSEYSSEVIRLLVKYLYSTQPFSTISVEHVGALMILADQIGEMGLRTQCEKIIGQHALTLEDVLDLGKEALEWITANSFPELHKHVINVLEQNIMQLLASETFSTLPPHLVETLSISENVIKTLEQNFKELSSKDRMQLPPKTVQRLFSSDALRCNNELEFFAILQEWAVHRSKGNREKARALLNGLSEKEGKGEVGTPGAGDAFNYFGLIRFEHISPIELSQKEVVEWIDPDYSLKWFQYHSAKISLKECNLGLDALRLNRTSPWRLEKSENSSFVYKFRMSLEQLQTYGNEDNDKDNTNILSPKFVLGGMTYWIYIWNTKVWNSKGLDRKHQIQLKIKVSRNSEESDERATRLAMGLAFPHFNESVKEPDSGATTYMQKSGRWGYDLVDKETTIRPNRSYAKDLSDWWNIDQIARRTDKSGIFEFTLSFLPIEGEI